MGRPAADACRCSVRPDAPKSPPPFLPHVAYDVLDEIAGGDVSNRIDRDHAGADVANVCADKILACLRIGQPLVEKRQHERIVRIDIQNAAMAKHEIVQATADVDIGEPQLAKEDPGPVVPVLHEADGVDAVRFSQLDDRLDSA